MVMASTIPPHVPEIVWFTASQSFQENPEDQLVAISDPKFGEAVDCAYYGFHTKDKSTGVLIMGWKNLEAHHVFMEQESYPDLILSFMDAFVGPGHFLQLVISGDPAAPDSPALSPLRPSRPSTPQLSCSCSTCGQSTPPILPKPMSSMTDFRRALSAPFVQFYYLTVRPSQMGTPEVNLDSPGVQKLAKLVQSLDQGMKTIESCLASCWAPAVTLGTEHMVVGIVGWESFQHCKRETRSGGRLGTLMASIEKTAFVEWTYGILNRIM